MTVRTLQRALHAFPGAPRPPASSRRGSDVMSRSVDSLPAQGASTTRSDGSATGVPDWTARTDSGAARDFPRCDRSPSRNFRHLSPQLSMLRTPSQFVSRGARSLSTTAPRARVIATNSLRAKEVPVRASLIGRRRSVSKMSCAHLWRRRRWAHGLHRATAMDPRLFCDASVFIRSRETTGSARRRSGCQCARRASPDRCGGPALAGVPE